MQVRTQRIQGVHSEELQVVHTCDADQVGDMVLDIAARTSSGTDVDTLANTSSTFFYTDL